MSETLLSSVESLVTVESVGELILKGFAEPVPAYNVLSLREG
jgi:class 3 adenylate cyclase